METPAEPLNAEAIREYCERYADLIPVRVKRDVGWFNLRLSAAHEDERRAWIEKFATAGRLPHRMKTDEEMGLDLPLAPRVDIGRQWRE